MGAVMSDARAERTRRRKLLALGGLGAVLGLAVGPRRAAAGHDAAAPYASAGVLHLGVINDGGDTGNSETQTSLNAQTTLVANTNSSFSALRVVNIGPGGDAIRAVGGFQAMFGGGEGVVATGGNTTSGFGGKGLDATGGTSDTNRGGIGVQALGGNSSSGEGGHGIDVSGGNSTSHSGGTAVDARGGDTSATAGNRFGGNGVFARGGNVRAAGVAAPGNGVVGTGGFRNADGDGLPDPGTSGGKGVFGLGGGASGFQANGVLGVTNSTNEAAVHGENQGTGPGVRGESGVFGNGSGIGVHGLTGSGDGVRGESATGSGVRGTSAGNFTQGVLGEGTGGNAHGVTGTSINAFGLSGTSTNSKGLVGVNTNGNDFAGLFIGHGANPANNTGLGIFVKGRAVITGGVSVNALTSSGPRLLHGIQAADDLAEDVGRGQLQGGRTRVNLDPLFAETIKTDDYHVFLTPHSVQSRGLALAARDGRGFEVGEIGGGAGSYAFDWRVVAERKGAPASSRLMRVRDPDIGGALEKLGRPVPETPPERPTPPSDPTAPAGPRRR